MKKFKSTLLLFLAVLTINSYGDVIVPKYPPAKVYMKINNLNDYPDIVIIGVYICSVVFKSNKAFILEPDSLLEIHKSCPFKLYAVKKSYFEKKGIKKIKWEKDENVIESNLLFSGKFTPFFPIHTVEMNFIIAGFNDTSMVMHQATHILKYSDGRSDDVRNYDYKGDLSKLQKGF